mmetsp:Transcript_32802/g.93083  ORF Transcript_32802/g.93083 Transcript_32802/m.93083 type:complete len:258 (-) Transcript_32802:463-1236(-)
MGSLLGGPGSRPEGATAIGAHPPRPLRGLRGQCVVCHPRGHQVEGTLQPSTAGPHVHGGHPHGLPALDDSAGGPTFAPRSTPVPGKFCLRLLPVFVPGPREVDPSATTTSDNDGRTGAIPGGCPASRGFLLHVSPPAEGQPGDCIHRHKPVLDMCCSSPATASSEAAAVLPVGGSHRHHACGPSGSRHPPTAREVPFPLRPADGQLQLCMFRGVCPLPQLQAAASPSAPWQGTHRAGRQGGLIPLSKSAFTAVRPTL